MSVSTTQEPELDCNALLATASEAADVSDALILQYFRSSMAVDNKLSDRSTADAQREYDPVTEADRGAEQEIRNVIAQAFPDHGIVGEEFGTELGTSGYDWIIDPIDGTRAFVAGLPTFGTLIGVYHNTQPYFGLMSQPFTRERFWGSANGSGYDGPGGARDLQTSTCESLTDAVLASTTPEMFKSEDEHDRFEQCRSRARIVRFGGDCYSYCLLAAGHIDVVIESSLETYDIAALIPIIEGAGGLVTDWSGGSAKDGGQIVATANAKLHDDVLEYLAVR